MVAALDLGSNGVSRGGSSPPIRTASRPNMNLWSIYHPDIPHFLQELSSTAAMQRLNQVGMNCGCEYTNFPLFHGLQPYSRYTHSVGVGLIVWHFTQSVQQSTAALLHDIATPVFAHVVDFLHGDHIRQESTEDHTLQVIADDKELVNKLKALSLSPEDVADYHLYPIADNNRPRLSADRLEYTLGNIVNFGFDTPDTVKHLYEDLCVGANEEGNPEIMFRHLDEASLFARLSLRCSKVYVSDEDRYAMQMLAELLKEAINANVITMEDLMLTEPDIIRKLNNNLVCADKWTQFRQYQVIICGNDHPKARIIQAKKRCIDPFVLDQKRVSKLDFEYQMDLESYLQNDFDYYIYAK